MKYATRKVLNNFVLRSYQIPIADALVNKGYKKVIAILPRRAGKDIVAWNLSIRQCLEKVCVVFYIFPTYSQAKKVIWDSITNEGLSFHDFIPDELVRSRNSQEMKITFVNGSILQLIGSDHYDSLVGTNPYGCVFSEYAIQDARAYHFIRPILAANDGWTLFISTPRGKNHLWELYQIALHHNDWFAYKLTLDDTKHIPLREIERERAEGLMSEDLIQQEYYCFPGESPVLTSSGIKKISDINVNDMVISHSGRFRAVKNLYKRDYDGPMVEISSFGSYEKIRCTPEHPIMCYDKEKKGYAWKVAKDITKGDYLVYPKKYISEDTKRIKFISYELAMLIAWYISDGSASKNAVNITINAKKFPRVKELLDALEYKYTYILKEECSVYNVCVKSVNLVDFLRINCGVLSSNKRIPLELINGYEKEFFYELMAGDGCFVETSGNQCNRYSFSTTSKSLAYQVQFLSHSIRENLTSGISYRVGYPVKFPHGKVYDCQDSYSVQINIRNGCNKKWHCLRTKKNSIIAKVKHIGFYDYKGYVYNLGVQYDESYIVAGRSVHNCSFDMGIEGSYYAKYINKMRLNNQIGIVPYETGFRVNTAWDLGAGKDDSTAIIFFQIVGQTIRIIDCYEIYQGGLDHFVKVLDQKNYIYDKHFAPFDIAVRELGTGLTRLERAKQLGLHFKIAPPPVQVTREDGIESVRANLSKCWIDEEKCAPLIKALENYRREFDSKRGTYKAIPIHDRFSHFADAMRTLCICLPKTGRGTTPEELEKRYRETVYENEELPKFFR